MNNLQTLVSERRTYSDVGCSHQHTYAQLVIPLTGTLFIETPQQQIDLDEAALFFLPAGCHHYFYGRDANECLTLDIPTYLVGNLGTNGQGIWVYCDDRWQAIRTLLLADLSETRSESGSRLHLVQYMRTLLDQPNPSRSLQYLHQHYHQTLEIAQLARLEGYNPAYYSVWFKMRTGQSPKAYLQDLRLKEAKRLLAQTDLPIQQYCPAGWI